MEPQEQKIYCYCNKECKSKKTNCCNCLGIVAAILLVAFAITLGLIVGAAVSATILANLAALIVLAVVLALLFILALILKFCKVKSCS